MEYPSLDKPKAGALRFNTDSSRLEIYDGNQWTGVVDWVPNFNSIENGTRGVLGSGRSEGGGAQTNVNNIQYINISSTGNATDFGDTIDPNSRPAGTCSSRTRGIFLKPSDDATMEYITISSTGNSAEFGEDDIAGKGAAVSNQTRGINMAGSSSINSISYITIAQLGNAVDFGDVTGGNHYGNSGFGNQTRGITVCGRIAPSPSDDGNSMHYITISTLGNSSEFGDLTEETYASGTASNATRGLVAGFRNFGHPAQSNYIDYVTIATLGNAIRFGELNRGNTPYASYNSSGVASSTRAVFCGGYGAPAPIYVSLNTMEYMQFATEGNSVDFGDLSQAVRGAASVSNGHGGL